MTTHNARHDLILERLARDGAASVAELATALGVDLVTIRRDLAALARQGALRRTRGGAVPSPAGRVEFAFVRGQQTHAREKQAIAAMAAATIEPGMTITLDTGTTTLELARRVSDMPELKVLTSSLAVAAVLYPHAGIELVLLGGIARRGSPDLFGMLTEENLHHFRVDTAYVGADAVTRDGLYTTDMRIARVSKAILAGAKRTVLVADASKFQKTAFVRFAEWPDIDCVFTDDGITPDIRAWLRDVCAAVTYCSMEQTKERD